RLQIPPERMNVIYNGIDLTGYEPQATTPNPPVIGFLAHLCRVKGLETLVEAFIVLKARGRIPGVRLHIAGSANAADEPFVQKMKDKIDEAGLTGDTRFQAIVNRQEESQLL